MPPTPIRRVLERPRRAALDRRQETQDAVFAPIAEVLFARARVAPGERVIDVGCGCGATTLEIAARVGATGRALGLDVSAPMIARARERAPARRRRRIRARRRHHA